MESEEHLQETFYIMLNEGTEALPYEPYGTTTTYTQFSIADGAGSVAIGAGTHAKKQASTALGLGTVAARDRQVVIGQYNVEDTTNGLVMGWGWTSNDPKNVMTVSTEGAGWFRGGLFVNGSNKETAQKVATEAKATEIAKNEVTKLVNGAPAALDTLNELATALRKNENIVNVLEDAIENKFDKVFESENLFIPTESLHGEDGPGTYGYSDYSFWVINTAGATF
jgi:hypothetical protein